MTITKDELSTLRRFRLAATPKHDDVTMVMRELNRRGLLSIRPVDKHVARVQTTEAGMELVRQAEGGK